MRAVFVILAIAFVVCFMAFVVYNSDQKVDVNKQPFADGTFNNVALAEVVFWAFLAGVFFATLFFVTLYIRQSVQLRSARKRVRGLEGEVTILRNRPIEESAELLRGVDERSGEFESPFVEKDSKDA